MKIRIASMFKQAPDEFLRMIVNLWWPLRERTMTRRSTSCAVTWSRSIIWYEFDLRRSLTHMNAQILTVVGAVLFECWLIAIKLMASWRIHPSLGPPLSIFFSALIRMKRCSVGRFSQQRPASIAPLGLFHRVWKVASALFGGLPASGACCLQQACSVEQALGLASNRFTGFYELRLGPPACATREYQKYGGI